MRELLNLIISRVAFLGSFHFPTGVQVLQLASQVMSRHFPSNQKFSNVLLSLLATQLMNESYGDGDMEDDNIVVVDVVAVVVVVFLPILFPTFCHSTLMVDVWQVCGYEACFVKA